MISHFHEEGHHPKGHQWTRDASWHAHLFYDMSLENVISCLFLSKKKVLID